MKKLLAVLVAVVAAISVSAVAGAGAGNGAQVTRATLLSSWDGVEMTCDETQVINANGRKETAHCQLPATGGKAWQGKCPNDVEWYSDFPGPLAYAVECHVTITPTGEFNGWFKY